MAKKITSVSKTRSKVATSDGADSSSAIELSIEQLALIENQYKELLGRLNLLMDEVVFILAERIKNAGIKIHGIEHRIKNSKSILDKCRRKGIVEIHSISDLVGTRVVCLFRSDIAAIERLLKENFEVVSVDDKIEAESSPLGYLSVHYLCRLPARYKGPRYENTSGLVFEVQVRTLCMHAWAAVSHHLDYKGDWDVPAELKRSLSALSGLFYVADSEFEQFYAARLDSKKRAEKSDDVVTDQEINLDTMTAFLATKFPERVQSDAETVSKLVHNLKAGGYNTIAEVNRDYDRSEKAFEAYEIAHPPSSGQFYSVGAIRIGLQLASDRLYKNLRGAFHSKTGKPDDLLKFKGMVAPLASLAQQE